MIVVFLSSKCGTCLSIADAFEGGSPASVWFIVTGPDAVRSPILSRLVSVSDRVIVDSNERIARHVGLDVLPAVLTMNWGEVVRAHAVSSPRQVMNLIPTIASLNLASDLSIRGEEVTSHAS